MTEHTPGPWEYVPSNENHGPYVVGPHGGDIADCYTMSNPGSFAVCNGGDSKPIHFFHEMADPNARLIAAAPDMLRALQELEAIIDFDADISPCACFPDPDGLRNAVRMAREALAKAEGASATVTSPQRQSGD